MSSPQNKGLFRSMSPAFSLLSLSNKDGLSSKEKKYINSVEKLINTFDTSIVEWADHISFLSRLLKNLQLNPQTELTRNYIPFDLEISKCLSISLSKTLPSGVHKKALEVYDYIFQILGPQLSEKINIWLPGLLPLMSYASMGVKPQLVQLFNNYIIKLPNKTLKKVLRPVLLSLLPSIDDETSDNFNECLQLLDNLKANTQDDVHFWHIIFLIIITSNDKRLGALVWCQRRLPSFNAQNEESLETEESKSCISPSPKLFIKAISKGLIDDNIFVQRGFFDLLVSHLELKSFVLQDLCDESTKRELIMNASTCVLRKDMSLNRRLWNWLLGPDDNNNEQQSASGEDKISRFEYFAKYGVESLTKGLLELINGENQFKSASEQRIESFKISLAIMDKWEIGQLIIPKILIPILANTETLQGNEEVLKFANTFFDNVDCSNIWSAFLQLILNKNLKLCLFILQNFDVEEEEMIVNHLPLILLALLCVPEKTGYWNELSIAISNLIPQRAYLPIGHADKDAVKALDSEKILDMIKTFYSNNEDSDQQPPFKASDLSFIILEQLSNLITQRISSIYKSQATTDPLIGKLCELFSDVLDKIPQLDSSQVYYNAELVQYVFAINDHENCLELTFGAGKIFNHLIKADIDVVDKVVFLQDYLHQLWILLSSNLSVKYQVEIVKLIFHLEISMSSNYVEAAITKFFQKETSIVEKLAKFNLLWVHSTNFQDYGIFLNRSVELIMDDLQVSSNEPYIKNWIMLLISNGNINRFVKILISSSLLKFSFLNNSNLSRNADFAVYDYQLSNVIKFITMDKKILEVLKSELVVIDNEQLIEIIKLNKWENLGNYKMLILEICFKLIQLEKSDNSCFIKALEIISLLIDGNELEFKNYFNILLKLVMSIDDDLLKIELINLILKFLKISKTKSVALFNENEINDDNLILQLLLDGILKMTSSSVLVSLVKLLSESLNVFKDYIFSMILKLSNTMILKINEFFENLQSYVSGESELLSPDIDQSISLLMSGLEELLSVSHSYLLAHQLDHGDSSTTNNQDAGFFGSVIQGVFQLEQHQESNTGLLTKKIAVLLSLKNSVNSIYKIWLWAEVNSKLNLTTNDNNGNNSNKSLIYIATRYKYRSKKFLEFLYLIEPLEVLESLISYNLSHENKLIFKILHILDGSRPNLTLPHLFESINSRCGGVNSDDKINNELNERHLSKFLFEYFESLDKNIYEDLYGMLNNFIKTILATPSIYKQIYPDILKVIVLVDIGLSNDLKKFKRELNESFVKMLTIVINSKLGDSEDDFLKSLNYSIPLLSSMQFDADKLNLTYNTIINYLQPYLIKNDLKNDLIEQSILLINDQATTNKNWKSLVNDVTINNNYFFSQHKSQNLILYNNLISKNFSNDYDKIHELLARLTVNNSNFLNWNDYTEILNGKKLNLKRIIYIISCCSKNNYINLISDLITKIKELITDKDLKVEIYLLIRCLILKFNDTYLSNLWIIIYNELFKLFSNLVEDHSKYDVEVIFSGCKLLDVLIFLKPEEFQLNEWLFIADNDDGAVDSNITSLIDQINKLDLTEKKDKDQQQVEEDVNGNNNESVQKEKSHSSCPLLLEVKSVDSLRQLQETFFAKLSAANWSHILNEGGDDINQDLLEQDIFNDLF